GVIWGHWIHDFPINILSWLGIIALIGITLLANINSINLSYSSTELELLRSNDNGLHMKLNMEEITSFDVITEEGAFSQINIGGFTHSKIIGAPKLPIIRKIISVPYGAEISAKALNYKTMKYQLQDFGINNPLLPAQLPVPKSADPSETVFSYNPKAYSKNQFTSNELISVEELGIMRGVRLFVVEVSPIQYNPVEGTILVLNNIEIQVDFIGGDHAQTQWERSRTYSPYFEASFANSIFNYSHARSRDQITQYPIKYVIISDPMFQTQLQPFIEWKTEKGFEVIEAYTDEPNVGNTTTSIKSFLQDLYDAGTPEDPAPSFVLFVGDVAQIPAWNGSTGSHITDLNYVKLDGTDFVADMYYGRFSANNTTELQPQIDKTLEYEKYEMPDPSYLEEVVMIAGVDANFAPTHGNGQINYGTTNYFNAAHGILSHTYLYPLSGSSSAQIIQNVSDGIGYINYTAHGSSTSWSNPSFTIPNINSLQNEHKYGLAVGNCCLTNKFEVYTCFGEAWLRAENKGAIGYIGGTNSTYWDEDFWWGVGVGTPTANPTYESTGQGVYDGLFHDHGEDFTDWYTTAAGMIFNGNLAVTEGGGMINYYWEIYSLMGDPSLTAYLGVPEENLATYPDVIFLGLDNIQITAEPYSYVSLTMDGVIHGNGLIDESGVISLDFEAFITPGMAKLVITRQNCQPLIDEIEVIPSGGPYVIFESYTIDDTATGNGNGSLENGEIVDIDMSVENLG
ncbi:MAG: C25 family cysteine peptidase, partial [Candidatus Cloacimonetes bacterium]|nr:C25 family cysteine peptidase [Candidatus Cloacimonadota bacterium]